jgi:hypothetical protein
MSEISEEEDALLANLLLNTDLVSEENVGVVRDLQSNLREQGIKVSIVDLLLQSDMLSRSDLNSLRSLIEEKTEAGDALMPARFEYPFLTQKGLADRAKEEGVISDQTFQRMSEIQEQLEEQGISKTGGEVLVEQGFVEPEELQFDESSSEDGFMDRIDEAGDDIPESPASSPSTSSQSEESPAGTSSRSRVMSELDRYVLEELVDRGRMDRSQISEVIEAARKRDKEGSGGSAVQDELRDRGILHPKTESEVLSAAMDRREQAQQWQNRFGNTGPLVVTVLVVLCSAAIIYAFYGPDDRQTPSDSTAVNSTTTDSSEGAAATSQRETTGEEEQTEDQQELQEEEQQQPRNLLTFEADFGPLAGRILANQNCECEIRFEGAMVSQVSGSVNEEGVVRIPALSASETGGYAPGFYTLHCQITERAGSSLPSFPSTFLYPLEEYGPTDQPYFNQFLNGELWDFVTVAALPSSESSVEESRISFGRKLRAAVQSITEQWETVEPLLSREDPDSRQLREEFRTLYQDTRTIKKQLGEFQSYQTFYYPSVRERLAQLMDDVPAAVARLMIKKRKQQDMDVPSDLQSVAGSGSGGSVEAIRAVVRTLQQLRDRLPGDDESPSPAQDLKPIVHQELRKLMQLDVVLRYLSSHSDVQNQAIEQQQDMAKYYFLSFYKYAFAQISMRSVFLKHTSDYQVFDEQTGERIDGVSARMKGRLGQVIRDLVGEFNIELPQRIPESNQFEGDLREHIAETFRRAGMDGSVLEVEQ